SFRAGFTPAYRADAAPATLRNNPVGIAPATPNPNRHKRALYMDDAFTDGFCDCCPLPCQSATAGVSFAVTRRCFYEGQLNQHRSREKHFSVRGFCVPG